jgi:hypothetical protein
VRDDEWTGFDDQARDVLVKYAVSPKSVLKEISYLDNLVVDGKKFKRCRYSYKSLLDNIQGFFEPEKSSFEWNKHFQLAVEIIRNRYPNNLQMLNYVTEEDIVKVIKKKDASAGWDKVLTGKGKKGMYFDDGNILKFSRETESLAKEEGSFNDPILLGHRTQASGEYDEFGNRTNFFKEKSRPVMMISLRRVLAEQKFSTPINNWIKNYSYSAIGKFDKYISKWVHNCKSKFQSWLSLDYSKYDSTIPSWLLHAAFDVVEGMFSSYDKELFTILRNDFIYKNIVLHDSVRFSSHGTASGSSFTALVNGICNEIITETWANALGYHLKYMIMGDDNLLFIKEVLNPKAVEQISSYISHNFGIIVNADKSTFGDCFGHPEFLSRTWVVEGPYRPFSHIISKICFPERKRPYWEPGVTPELVLYGYLLAYPAKVNKWFDSERFRRENPNLSLERLASEGLGYLLPYGVQTALGVAS